MRLREKGIVTSDPLSCDQESDRAELCRKVTWDDMVLGYEFPFQLGQLKLYTLEAPIDGAWRCGSQLVHLAERGRGGGGGCTGEG